MKESQLENKTAIATNDYVRIVDENGNSVKIKKDSFMAAIRDALPSIISDGGTDEGGVLSIINGALKSRTDANLASVLGGMKVALGGSAASVKTVRITITNVTESSLCFIAYKKFGSFGSQYGKAYMGVRDNNGYMAFSNFFTGTEAKDFELTAVEGSTNVFEGNMNKYSGINVFYWNCNVTIA